MVNNNFIFDNEGLRIFKAYGIGEEQISSHSLEAISKNMPENCGYQVKAFPLTPTTRSLLNKKSSSKFLSYTDQDCVKQFKIHNQLLDHLLKGNHLYDSEKADSLEDTTKRLWAETCVSVRGHQYINSTVTEAIDSSSLFAEVGGYALKKRKKNRRFSLKVKDYVRKVFETGETSGRKANPYIASKNMRYEVDENGQRLFTPAEWLNDQQIWGLFASFTSKKQQPQQTKRLELEDEVQNDYKDKDLQNTVSALIAEEHMDVVASITNVFS